MHSFNPETKIGSVLKPVMQHPREHYAVILPTLQHY